MATITKTYTENQGYTSGRATWTLVFTGTDVSSNKTGQFVIPTPTLTAKYVSSSRGRGEIQTVCFLEVPSASADECSYLRNMGTMTSGQTYTIAKNISYLSAQQVSKYFNSSNPTVREVNVPLYMSYIQVRTVTSDDRYESYYNNGSQQNLGTILKLTIDEPPTFTASNWQKDTSIYVAGVTNVSVDVSNATAYYGGTISSAKLTVGTQEAAISGNGIINMTLQNAGTFTPSVTVTDSRGQTKTENLASITVIPYEKPSVDFDIFRTDEDGIKSDEGNYGVITANLTYMGEVANLTEPTISINNTSLTNYYAKTLDTVVDNNKTYYTYSEGSYTVVANPIDADIDLYYEKASVTWYLNYNSQTGISTPITDWSQVGSNNTATIYGLVDACFAALESYQITFVETDSLNGQSEAITQMLSTAFYTIDFQADGKEIAFGAPANDDLTDIDGIDCSDKGLFKCNMDAMFRDRNDVVRLLFDFVYPVGSYYETSKSQAEFDPNVVWGGTWELDSVGKVTVSRDANDTSFDTIGDTGGSSTVTLTANQSGNQALTATVGNSLGTHSHNAADGYFMTVTAGANVAINGTKRAYPAASSSGTYWVRCDTAAGIGEYQSTAQSASLSHSHTVTVAAKDAVTAHENMPPYVVVNRWHRIA